MAGTTKRSRENENENEIIQSPTKRPRYNYNDTISVLVGSEERSFVVHKDVREGQEKVVRLPTVKPSVFEMYIDWLYFGEIVNNASYKTCSLLNPLIRLSLLGDLVDDRNLRNKAIVALQVKAYKEVVSPGAHQIRLIWESTSEGSMLRKWALDSIFPRHRGAFEECVAEYPSEFLQQIAVKAMQHAPVVSGAEFLAKRHEYQEADEDS